MKIKIRLITTVTVFLLVFLGLLSMVGNVHVAEFYGALFISTIVAIIAWFKLPKIVEKH